MPELWLFLLAFFFVLCYNDTIGILSHNFLRCDRYTAEGQGKEGVRLLRSMTGYGRSQKRIGDLDLLVEIRSVNHRYFEVNTRIPRAYGYLEEKLKTLLQSKIARGKVEVALTLNHAEGSDALIAVNQSIAQGYVDALRAANEQLGLQDDLTLAGLLRLPDLFRVQKAEEDEDAVWDAVSQTAQEALDRFVAMRETEGERLKADILGRLSTLEALVERVEQASPGLTEQYRQRLTAKLQEVLSSQNIDEQRIVTEAAIFSEKVAVDEETVRLHSHIAQYRTLLELGEPVGRKLDFLTQELNRETNTIGSKAQDLEITQWVVEMKSEIEKIREQIQNVE